MPCLPCVPCVSGGGVDMKREVSSLNFFELGFLLRAQTGKCQKLFFLYVQ